MRQIPCTIAVLLAVALAGCAAALPPVLAADIAYAQQQWPESTAETLQQGRQRYVVRCSNCHALIVPSAHQPGRWRKEINEMSKRAHVLPLERDLILQYLVTQSRDATKP